MARRSYVGSGWHLVRRLSWHRDPFHRVSVVLSGYQIRVEFRDGSETLRVPVKRGQVEKFAVVPDLDMAGARGSALAALQMLRIAAA